MSNSVSGNLFKNLIFVDLLLIEDYEQGALRKESIIAPFTEQFQTTTLRKWYW